MEDYKEISSYYFYGLVLIAWFVHFIAHRELVQLAIKFNEGI